MFSFDFEFRMKNLVNKSKVVEHREKKMYIPFKQNCLLSCKQMI